MECTGKYGGFSLMIEIYTNWIIMEINGKLQTKINAVKYRNSILKECITEKLYLGKSSRGEAFELGYEGWIVVT